ncbi:GNAT family N-acetyltransferase [Shewanella sp. BF02_Schw]|uniref:GNAT family N-acetyltransferase n=1 Tax=Shewanella sp. BF02_Schw TaxID=394908 RepID=UPI00177C1D25|nr:GNAT family N-acetyltransferase [Shewanella sp. BF02_Schw]MBO1897764.1 GNAT family N-acetyltransferase [Shewanella sp. BF02_Schw]
MEVGYEDIYSVKPYFDIETSSRDSIKIALLHLMYVPPELRGQGRAKSLFNELLAELPKEVEYIRLKSAPLGTGCTMKFWQSLGFTPAYTNCYSKDEGKILHLAVNGFSLPAVEALSSGDERHYIFD